MMNDLPGFLVGLSVTALFVAPVMLIWREVYLSYKDEWDEKRKGRR